MDALANLGINFTSMLQYVVNIFLLVVVLWVLLYRPILQIIDKRRAMIAQSVSEAETLKTEFEKKLASMEAEQKALHARLEEEAKRASDEIAATKAELLSDMQQRRQELMEQTAKDIQEAKNTLVQKVEHEVLDAMKQIVVNILRKSEHANAVEASIQEEWSTFKKNHNIS